MRIWLGPAPLQGSDPRWGCTISNSHAVMTQSHDALAHLKDSDLDPVRNHPQFQKLLEIVG